MLASAIPYKFGTPWAASAAGGYVTSTIPATASGAAASQALGFPPATATPTASGGTPPSIADINGVLNYATSWARWQQSGGPVGYDATFSTAIGGYPKGALLSSATNGGFWLSTVDANITNPDAAGAGWQSLFTGLATQVALAAEASTRATADALLTPLASFGTSGAANGYQKLPSGIIIQWGQNSVGAPSFVTFPLAFPNACFSIVVSEGAANPPTWGSAHPTIHGAQNPIATGYSAWAESWTGSGWTGSSITQNFIAIGW